MCFLKPKLVSTFPRDWSLPGNLNKLPLSTATIGDYRRLPSLPELLTALRGLKVAPAQQVQQVHAVVSARVACWPAAGHHVGLPFREAPCCRLVNECDSATQKPPFTQPN